MSAPAPNLGLILYRALHAGEGTADELEAAWDAAGDERRKIYADAANELLVAGNKPLASRCEDRIRVIDGELGQFATLEDWKRHEYAGEKQAMLNVLRLMNER